MRVFGTTRLLIATAVACALPMGGAAAATLCVHPTKSGCIATIQGAVDAADPDDEIKVLPHPDIRGYRENVSVAKQGLEIFGVGKASGAAQRQTCPKTVVDGCETGSNPTTCRSNEDGDPAFLVTGDGVTIRNLTIRHSSDAVTVDGAADVTISQTCFINNGSGGVYSSDLSPSPGLTVERSVFQNGDGHDIAVEGDGITVTRNSFFVSDDILIIRGDDAVVTRNLVEASNDGELEVKGHDAVVQQNIMRNTEAGVRVVGQNPDVQDNQVSQVDDILLEVDCVADPDDPQPDTCTGGLIAGNKLVGQADELPGIDAFGGNLTIRGNTVEKAIEEGILVEGDGNVVEDNRVVRAGTENFAKHAGIVVDGDGNQIRNNQVRLSGLVGIQVLIGDSNTIEGNEVVGSGRGGIWVVEGDGNTVDGNTVKDNHGEGIANGSLATNTDIDANRLSNNRTDVCNDGTVDSFTGNVFESGGDTTACVVQVIVP